MPIIDSPHTIFGSHDAAAKVADACNADSDGWRYVIVDDPKGSGRATIDVYDDENVLMGKL